MTEVSKPAKGADLVTQKLCAGPCRCLGLSTTQTGAAREAGESPVGQGGLAVRPVLPCEPMGCSVSALPGFDQRRGWETQAAGASVLARWDSLVGEQVAAHCRPTRLRDGELTIEAESTAWATQLGLLSRTLTRHACASSSVSMWCNRWSSGVRASPDWRHGALRVSGGRGPRDTYG